LINRNIIVESQRTKYWQNFNIYKQLVPNELIVKTIFLMDRRELKLKEYILKNGEKLIIRNGNPTDAEEMIDYLNIISTESEFLTFGKGEINISIQEERKTIEDCLKSDNKLFIIAEINGKIIGGLVFRGGHRSRTRHTGEFGVSILKEYWGLGIGEKLITYLKDWATQTNIIKKINLRVREDHKRGIKLYQKLGFTVEGVLTKDFYIDGKYFSSILMGMEID